jgi:hypothetical protein
MKPRRRRISSRSIPWKKHLTHVIAAVPVQFVLSGGETAGFVGVDPVSGDVENLKRQVGLARIQEAYPHGLGEGAGETLVILRLSVTGSVSAPPVPTSCSIQWAKRREEIRPPW